MLQNRINVNLAGLALSSPLMLASGVLGQTGDSLANIANSGAGAVVTKSIGPAPNPGHPGPNIIEVDCGFINSMGLPNPGAENFIEEIKVFKEKSNKPIIVSIYGSTEEEYAFVAETFSKADIDAIEINVSCPHSREKILNIGLSPEMVKNVIFAVKNAIRSKSIPLFLKLAGNTHIENQLNVAKAAIDAGIDGLVAINTLPAIAIDIWTERPVLGFKIGGLSGPAIKPVAVRIVYELFKKFGTQIPIIGVGGIITWKDAVEFMLAGATAVQIGSGIAYRNITIFKEINDGLVTYLNKKKIGNIREIIGKAHRY